MYRATMQFLETHANSKHSFLYWKLGVRDKIAFFLQIHRPRIKKVINSCLYLLYSSSTFAALISSPLGAGSFSSK